MDGCCPAGTPRPVAGWLLAARTVAERVVGAVRNALRLMWLALIFAPVLATAQRALAAPPGSRSRRRCVALVSGAGEWAAVWSRGGGRRDPSDRLHADPRGERADQGSQGVGGREEPRGAAAGQRSCWGVRPSGAWAMADSLALVAAAAAAVCRWMARLRGTLEAAGPAFIKWGQWAATRHDLFPPDMCSELEKLHRWGVEKLGRGECGGSGGGEGGRQPRRAMARRCGCLAWRSDRAGGGGSALPAWRPLPRPAPPGDQVTRPPARPPAAAAKRPTTPTATRAPPSPAPLACRPTSCSSAWTPSRWPAAASARSTAPA